jgi:hypothetical protein
MANYFDQFDAPSGKNYFDQFDAPKTPEKQPWTDAALAVGQGAVDLVKLPFMAAGAADTIISRAFNEQPVSGGALANAPVKALSDVSEYLESKKSTGLKAKEATAQTKIAEAGEKYADDFVVGGVPVGQIAAEAVQGIKEYGTDWDLFVQGLARNVTSIFPAMAGARVTQMTAETVLPMVAKQMTAQTVEKTALRLGTAGGITTGAIQQGADVASETYDRVLKLPDDSWAKNQRYLDLSADIGPEKAKLQVAGELATDAGIKSGLESLVVNAVGAKFGGATLESAMLKKAPTEATGGMFKGAIKGGLGEFTTEGLEEGYGAYAGNQAVAQVEPTTDLYKGVGAAAGQGALMGFAMGGAFGTLEGRHEGLISKQRQLAAEQLRQATDAAQAADAADALAGNLNDIIRAELTPAVDQYLGGNIPPAVTLPAAPMTLQERQAAADRNAQLMAQANEAGTEFDRQQSLAQAAAAMPAPQPGAAAGFVDLTPMTAMQAQQRMTVLRDQTAQEGGNALSLAVVPHPAQPDRFAIRQQALPSLELPNQQTPITPATAQARIESAALAGQDTNRRAEDQGRQEVIAAAMRRVEERGGVASPAEARIFQEAGVGKPYDRIDPSLAPALTTDERLTQATGIPLVATPRETNLAPQQQNVQGMAEQEARAKANAAQAQRETQQQIEQANKPVAAPDANAVISALQVAPAMRTAEQKVVVDQANSRMDPNDMGILQKAAQAPMLLSSTDKIQLNRLRQGEVAPVAPAPAAENGLLGTRVAARLATPSPGRILTSNATLSTQRTVAPGGTVSINEGVDDQGNPVTHTVNIVDTGRLGNAGRLIAQVGRIFGKRLVVFESDTLKADGFVLDNDNRNIYLNAKSQMSPVAVFGHELTHLFKRENNAAYDALQTVVQRNLAPEGMEKFQAEYGEGANIEELTSDLVGNRFQEADFWTEVFNEVAAQNPEGARGVVIRMAAALQKAINAFLQLVRQPGFQADTYVTDLQNIKTAVRQAMSEYAQQQRIPAMNLEAELAKAEAGVDLTATQGAENAKLSVPRGSENVPGAATENGRQPGEAGRAEVPSYGTGRQGAISVIGRHYSSSPQQSLSGAYYGRGLKGAERNRLDSSTDPRLKNRIYFYVDQGSGIRPESGVGGYAHEVKLDNIYDSQTGTIRPQSDLNGFESAVINAGFDGYIAPFGNNQAAVVLLGQKHKAVPVAQIGQPTSAPLPQAAAPTTLKKGLLSREANAIDVSKIPGAKMRMGSLEIPVEQTAAANAELERIGSDARFSKQRVIPEGIDSFARLENIIPRARSGTYNTNRELKVALQTAILAAAKDAKINLAEQNAQTEQYLTRVGVADAIYALQANANAVGWYDKTVTKALKVLGKIHPEINTDPNAKFAFTWALAVTSNGLKVDKNFELAEQAYRAYKNTGRMPSNIEAGQAQGAINKSLDLFNQMVDQYGIDNVRKFMDSKFAVSQIKRATGLEVTGEFAHTLVRGAAVLGPKIGNGFYANLNGFFDQLTMDRWLMRTWGRWTGTLIEARPDMVKLKREELRNFVVKMKQNAPAAAEFQKALGAKLTVGDLDGLAKTIQKASMDPDTREIFNKTPEGEGLRLNGNSLAKYLDGQKEAPDGPEERNFIRKVFGQILKEVQKEHPALTMSDLQALLWYPEKRLYDIAKSEESANQEEGYSDDEAPDYANAASKLARDLGVSDADIQSAGAEAEKEYASRISTGTAGRGTVEQATPGTAPAARGFAERESREFLTTGVVRGIRSAGTSDAGQPNSYTRKSGGNDKGLRVLNLPSVAVYSPATVFKNALAEIPVTPPKFFEVGANGATAFRDAIQEAKANSRFGAAVYVYPADEYAGMRLFLTEDGKAGFALKGDDIVSVFAGKEHPGAANAVLQLATQEGGRRLDAFDTVLPNMYALHGFRAVARTKWNDDYAPDGWNKDTFKEFNNGEPDVVFMVHDPEYFDAYTHADGPVIAEYDEGAKAQADALANIKQVRQTDAPKPASALSIFTGLDKRGLAKAKAETILAEHPDSARIKYVQENFLDILSELEDSDLVKINCD